MKTIVLIHAATSIVAWTWQAFVNIDLTLLPSKSWYTVTRCSNQTIVTSTTICTSEVDTIINSYSTVTASEPNWTRTGIATRMTVASRTIVTGVGVTSIDLSFTSLSRKARKAATSEHSRTLDTCTIVGTRTTGACIDRDFTLSSSKFWPEKITLVFRAKVWTQATFAVSIL